MDQIKIGIFIAEKRKEKHITQRELADKLGITDRAVSKWECGRSLPDSALMIPLCEILGISVNELLLGRALEKEDYRRETEKLLLEMKRKEEESNKYLLKLEIVIGTISTIAYIAILGSVSLLTEDLRILIPVMVLAFTLLIAGIYYAMKIEYTIGYYECPSCHYRYRPDVREFIFSPHIGRKRKLRCPNCDKKSYMKKVLTK